MNKGKKIKEKKIMNPFLSNLLLLLLLLGGALTPLQDVFAESKEKKLSITTQEKVVYHKSKSKFLLSKAFKGFVAQPAKSTDKKYPALILIHEWWGLNDYIKTRAKRFAKHGYVVLAVDLYGSYQGTANRSKAGKLAGAVRKNKQKAFANLKSAMKYLKNLPNVDSHRIGSLGWCFGGGWSYQMAKNNLGTKVSVIYYGRFNPKDDLKQMRALLLGHFAEKDKWIKIDKINQLQMTLKSLNGKHEIYIYPHTQHGFDNLFNDQAFDKKASALAWERTLRFLKANL